MKSIREFELAEFRGLLAGREGRLLPTAPLHSDGYEMDGLTDVHIYLGRKLPLNAGSAALVAAYLAKDNKKLASLVTDLDAFKAAAKAILEGDSVPSVLSSWVEDNSGPQETDGEDGEGGGEGEGEEDEGEDDVANGCRSSLRKVLSLIQKTLKDGIPPKYLHILWGAWLSEEDGRVWVEAAIHGIQLADASPEAFKQNLAAAEAELHEAGITDLKVFCAGNKEQGTCF